MTVEAQAYDIVPDRVEDADALYEAFGLEVEVSHPRRMPDYHGGETHASDQLISLVARSQSPTSFSGHQGALWSWLGRS